MVSEQRGIHFSERNVVALTLRATSCNELTRRWTLESSVSPSALRTHLTHEIHVAAPSRLSPCPPLSYSLPSSLSFLCPPRSLFSAPPSAPPFAAHALPHQSTGFAGEPPELPCCALTDSSRQHVALTASLCRSRRRCNGHAHPGMRHPRMRHPRMQKRIGWYTSFCGAYLLQLVCGARLWLLSRLLALR